MSGFEFIRALYAIIAGLGLSVLVNGMTRMIKHRDGLRFYWVHSGWLVFMFLAQIVSWFALWELRDHDTWSAAEALLLLLVPIFLYAVSYLAVPDLDEAGEDQDLRAYYFEQAQWMQGLLMLALLSASVALRVIEQRWDMTLNDIMRIATMLVLVPGILSPRPAIHATQMVCLLLVAVIAFQRVVVPVG